MGNISPLLTVLITAGCIFTHCAAGTLEIDVSTSPVHVTKGAVLVKIENMMMYTEEEILLHPISDLPDPMKPIAEKCAENNTLYICRFLNDNIDINQDSFQLINVLNKMMTYGGLASVERENTFVPDDMFEPNTDVLESDPNPLHQVLLHQGIIDNKTHAMFQEVLDNRRLSRKKYIQSTSSKRIKRMSASQNADAVVPAISSFGNRTRRRFGSIFLKSIPQVLKVAKHVWPKARKLFFNNDELFDSVILNVLSKSKFTKDEFMDSKTSEFVTETIKRLESVLAEKEDMLNKFTEFTLINENRFDTVDKQNKYYSMLSSLVTADQGHLIFTLLVYTVHLLSLQACRDGIIPLQFLPKSVLLDKLKVMTSSNNLKWELAIDMEDIDILYKMRPAECSYDSNGGVMTIRIPVNPKFSVINLYKIKPLCFSYGGSTCRMNINEQYVSFNEMTNSIHTLSNAEAAVCLSNEFHKCKVPKYSTAEFEYNYCLKSLLKESSALDVIKSCPIKCVPIESTEVVQISPNAFMVANMPATGKVECDDGYYKTINHNIKYGSLKVTLGCGCRLVVNDIVVATPLPETCVSQTLPSNIELYLPIHWTNNEEMLSVEGLDYNTRFLHFDGVFRFDKNLEHEKEPPESLYKTHDFWNIISDSLQYALLAFILWRQQIAPAMGLALPIAANAYPSSHKDHTHDCQLPNEAYFLLISITVMLCAIIGKQSLSWVANQIQSVWLHFVNRAARNQVIEMD